MMLPDVLHHPGYELHYTSKEQTESLAALVLRCRKLRFHTDYCYFMFHTLEDP